MLFFIFFIKYKGGPPHTGTHLLLFVAGSKLPAVIPDLGSNLLMSLACLQSITGILHTHWQMLQCLILKLQNV